MRDAGKVSGNVGLVHRGQVNDADVDVWRLAAKPHRLGTIRHGYSIKFQRNKALGQLEGT